MTKNKSFNKYEKIIFSICIFIINIHEIFNKSQELKKDKEIKQTIATILTKNIIYTDINNNIYIQEFNQLDIKYNSTNKIDIYYNLKKPYQWQINKNKLSDIIDKELLASLIFRISIFTIFIIFILYKTYEWYFII